MDTIESMAKAKGMDEKMIKKIVSNANRSVLVAKKRRDIHNSSRRGWSMNRGKTMLSETIMTTGMYLLLKDRYFPDDADDVMKVKLLEEFKRDYPQFRSR